MTTTSPNLVLVAVVVVLVAAGVYLILERSLTRVLVGVLILSNGINLLKRKSSPLAALASTTRPSVHPASASANGVSTTSMASLSSARPPPRPPLFDPDAGDEGMADPLPQAMILTAIVITLGLSAFLATLAYRSWQLNRHDEVQDDLEDRRVAARAAADLSAYEDLDSSSDVTLDEEAAEVHDDTVHEEALAEDAAREAAGRETGGGPRG